MQTLLDLKWEFEPHVGSRDYLSNKHPQFWSFVLTPLVPNSPLLVQPDCIDLLVGSCDPFSGSWNLGSAEVRRWKSSRWLGLVMWTTIQCTNLILMASLFQNLQWLLTALRQLDLKACAASVLCCPATSLLPSPLVLLLFTLGHASVLLCSSLGSANGPCATVHANCTIFGSSFHYHFGFSRSF